MHRHIVSWSNAVADSGPMSTKQLDSRAAEEANRKIAIKLTRNDKKNQGPEFAIAREDNGDILRWSHIGGAMIKEGDRYSIPKQKSDKVYEMQAESPWSSDLKKPQPRNRKDFTGSGNIISWM